MQRSELNDIIGFISDPLREVGLECLEAEWDDKEKILRLYIDGPDGVVIDDCVKASRKLSELEDLDLRIEGTYNLEVSSPGVERPLRTLEHFNAQVGKKVEAILTECHEDRKHAVGVISKVDMEDGRVFMETNRGEWSFPIDKLNSCKLKFDWQS